MPESESWLLQLPDPCLLGVLRWCADDHRSLFSAARAHSRLHQAAVLAASSVKAVLHQQADSVLQFLESYGQHVSSIALEGAGDYVENDSAEEDEDKKYTPLHTTLLQLPHHKLQGLSSLSCRFLHLQLQPGGGFQGVLAALAPLTQLQLDQCTLLDWEEGPAAALAQLPMLQHLDIYFSMSRSRGFLCLPSSTLPPQLTYLKLAGVNTFTAGALSGLQLLKHLFVEGSHGKTVFFEPDALAGKSRLQHLTVMACRIAGGSAGHMQLLAHLQIMQQLTHLDLGSTSLLGPEPSPTAQAYSALTASSQLQHLEISEKLPLGVWQHMFPAGRQLPHLKVLDISHVRHPTGAAPAPEGSRLVTCCPGLHALYMWGLQYSTELLAPLTGLSSLSKLMLHAAQQDDGSSTGLEVVPQLTGLQHLWLFDPNESSAKLMQLTQLKQLTFLEYGGTEMASFLSRAEFKASTTSSCSRCGPVQSCGHACCYYCSYNSGVLPGL
jgi:hypothetical protein